MMLLVDDMKAPVREKNEEKREKAGMISRSLLQNASSNHWIYDSFWQTEQQQKEQSNSSSGIFP
jgi:hypothetical protein